MSKRQLADVLWDAANKHLAAEPSEHLYSKGVHKWTCWAVARALDLHPHQFPGCENEPCYAPRVMAFLKSLGLDVSVRNLINRLPMDAQQGSRYMWLLLAMHVAEDEGITA